jgi:hypothetical protein
VPAENLEPNAKHPAMKALKESLVKDGIPFTAWCFRHQLLVEQDVGNNMLQANLESRILVGSRSLTSAFVRKG